MDDICKYSLNKDIITMEKKIDKNLNLLESFDLREMDENYPKS